jgi:hypothetical protein
MYLLKEHQIDFILNDIRRNGVELEDLQYNLLDHVCCIIEQELEENGDFEQFYQTTIRRFYKQRLYELEEETQSLLTFKNYYTMKKLMIGNGIVSAILLSFGILFKFNYWPGASFLLLSGITSLSFIFLPLYFTLKIKEEKQTRDKVLIGLSSLVCISICSSILFKIMHWPGANELGLGAVGIMVLLFLPIYFITGIRNPENKVNTVVSSVLIIAGCGLFLTLARSPKATQFYQQSITNQLVRSELILQNELQMVKRLNATDSSYSHSLSKQITQLCEDMKASIVLAETGCNSLTSDNNCKANLLMDGSVRHYFAGEESLFPKLNELRLLVEQYNESLGSGKQKIPVQSVFNPANDESIATTLLYFMQIEMFVLQNESELIAS